jgi:hypothetical protein
VAADALTVGENAGVARAKSKSSTEPDSKSCSDTGANASASARAAASSWPAPESPNSDARPSGVLSTACADCGGVRRGTRRAASAANHSPAERRGAYSSPDGRLRVRRHRRRDTRRKRRGCLGRRL